MKNVMKWNAALTSNQFTPFHAAGNGSGVKLRVNELRALREVIEERNKIDVINEWSDSNAFPASGEVHSITFQSLLPLPLARNKINFSFAAGVSCASLNN